MDGDGSPDTRDIPTSSMTLTLIAAVVSLMIFSGIIAAYPHGLHLSSSATLMYRGTDETFFSGELHIEGLINGTFAAHAVTQIQFSPVDEIRIVDAHHGEHIFTNTTLSVTAGNCTVNGRGLINDTLSPALAAYNTSVDTRLLVLTNDRMTGDYRGVISMIVSKGELFVGNGTWHGATGTYSLTIVSNARMQATAEEFLFSTDEKLTLHCDAASSFDDVFLDRYNISLPPLPFSLNGIIGILDAPTVGSHAERSTANITLLRGSGTAIVHDQIAVNASGPLLIQEGKFVTNERASFIWFIPADIVGLWPVALAAWIIGALVRKKWPTRFQDRHLPLQGLMIIVRILMLGVAAYLWDREIQSMFGKSILAALQSLVQGGASGLDAWIVAPFELIPWFAALVFIGLPVRILLATVGNFIGMGSLGNEAGKGAGVLATSLGGIAYIAFFLNVTLAPIVESFLG